MISKCTTTIIAFLLSVSAFSHAATAQPTVVYVNASAGGPIHDGNGWDTAYKDLQDALDPANLPSGTTQVWVAKGTYRPDRGALQTLGDQSASFALINQVEIYGGFDGTEAPGSIDLTDPSLRPNVTILTGDITGNDETSCNGDQTCGAPNGSGACVNPPFGRCTGDNSYHVVEGAGDLTAVLDGFTITAGVANGPENIWQNQGGGIRNLTAAPVIRNCTFTKNTAARGGGASSDSLNQPGTFAPKFENCVFSENTATNRGGGYWNFGRGSVSILTDCMGVFYS